MKKAFAALLLAALCLPLALGAAAEETTYVFPYEGFRYTQREDETVLTQTNLDRHEALIESLGTTKEAILASYVASGIVMEVLPNGGGQVAVSVADAGDFADVTRMSELDEERLAQFAAQFEDSGLYETCALTETDPVCVRLTSSAMYGSMPVYTLRYATLHLGRLYMLSQSVVGRAPQAEDDAVIARVLTRMELLSSLSAPTPEPTDIPTPAPSATPAPTPGVAQVLSQTGEMTVEGVPSYTTDSALTITGSAAPGATVRVRVGERSLGQTKAAQDGAFSVDVTLPGDGDLTLTVETDDASRELAVRYELPHISLTLEPMETTFTGTNVVVRGQTEPEATVYLSGKGTNSNVQASRTGAFSARIFIDGPATLTFTLRAHLRGFQDTSTDITLTRELTEREAFTEFRRQIVSVTYEQLAGDSAAYQGKKFIFRGRVMAFADYDGTPCALVLVSNVSTGVWRDPLWVVLEGGDEVKEEDILTFYLEGEGTTLPADGAYTESGLPVEAPVARAKFISENR